MFDFLKKKKETLFPHTYDLVLNFLVFFCLTRKGMARISG